MTNWLVLVHSVATRLLSWPEIPGIWNTKTIAYIRFKASACMPHFPGAGVPPGFGLFPLLGDLTGVAVVAMALGRVTVAAMVVVEATLKPK